MAIRIGGASVKLPGFAFVYLGDGTPLFSASDSYFSFNTEDGFEILLEDGSTLYLEDLVNLSINRENGFKLLSENLEPLLKEQFFNSIMSQDDSAIYDESVSNTIEW